MAQMHLTPLSEVVDEVWGKTGTKERDAMEKQLKEEKKWLEECERNVLLSKTEIEHLESCIKEAKGEQ